MHRRSIYVMGPIVGALISTGSSVACNGGTSPLTAFERDDALPAYSFNVDVAMAMRHFPWLHFHVQGIGNYRPGKSYVIHIDRLPWFAPHPAHDIDLSMLDPAMWPSRFLYQEVGEGAGNTVYALRAIDDPTLTSATVTLGPRFCTREVDTVYTGGTRIKLNVTFSRVGAFMLPARLTADIKETHLLLSANAQFSNYTFDSSSVGDSSEGPHVDSHIFFWSPPYGRTTNLGHQDAVIRRSL
jgi:hypothetical protein